MKKTPFIFILLCFYLCYNSFSFAQDKALDTMLSRYSDNSIAQDKLPFSVIKRKILGLYDSRNRLGANGSNYIQRFAATILNHYGYIAEPYDIRRGFPDEAEMKQYDVIITWFTEGDIPNAIDYLNWIEKQVSLYDKKLIVIEQTGLEIEEKTQRGYNYDLKARLLRLIDLEYRAFDRNKSTKVSIHSFNKQMMEYERKFDKYPGEYEWTVPIEDRGVKSWMTVEHKDFPNHIGHVVTTSPKGGYIKSGYAYWVEPEHLNKDSIRNKWYINPFLFFSEILGKRTAPIPDPTTKNGRRVFFSHVDGDAFNSRSVIGIDQYSSDVLYTYFRDEIPDIPIGVSYIGAEVDPFPIKGSDIKTHFGKITGNNGRYKIGKLGSKRLLKTAQKIAKLPNVELATHTYHHPYQWRGKSKTSAFKKGKFNLEFEIKGSVDFINKYIAPKGKRVEVIYWSGDTNPPNEAFDIVERIGIKNINGGDAMYDSHYNSITSLSPYARKMGKHWQIHSCQSNENLYTNLWREDFNGIENVIENYVRTESPRRLQCANLYYHFYSGTRLTALNALRKVYKFAKDQNYSLVFPSEYISMVEGFLSTELFKIGPNRYAVVKRGKLNTLRLDQGEVNPERSRGILKVNEINNSQYITLDPTVKFPIIQVEL